MVVCCAASTHLLTTMAHNDGVGTNRLQLMLQKAGQRGRGEADAEGGGVEEGGIRTSRTKRGPRLSLPSTPMAAPLHQEVNLLGLCVGLLQKLLHAAKDN